MKRFFKKAAVTACTMAAFVLFCGCASGGLNDAGGGMDGGLSESVPPFLWDASGEGNYQYDGIVEQGFYDTVDAPSSYFSLDRNTAGYSLVRAQLREGMQVEADSVRLEELVNYFDYPGYAAPAEGEEVGISAYVADCPWNAQHKLLTVGLKTEEAVTTGAANYVLLVDVSGSMDSIVSAADNMTRLDLVRHGAYKMLEGLGDGDRVSIVTYASGVKTVLESTLATQEGKAQIRAALASLTASGSTSGSDGLELAYRQAQAHKAEGNNRVILLTDGDFNVGISDTETLTEFIQDKAKSGIALSVVGVGLWNTRDDIMETLALNGNGNYSYIDTQLEAEKVFTQELSGTLYTVAHDAKAGVTFNADMVSSYRLLGYDMKTMSEDDFNNTQKDAGDIGSNLCVTAMYEIVPAASDTGEVQEAQEGEEVQAAALAEIAVRYRNTAGEDREVTRTVTGSEGETDDSRFAACVAEFALVLRRSKYASAASLSGVLSRLGDMTSYLAQDAYKQEFKELVSLAASRSEDAEEQG